jgi:hypothetical protein
MKKKKSIFIWLIFFITGFTSASFLPDTLEAAIDPTSYDFREVEVGVSQITVVTITNLGEEPTEITGVVFDRTNCSDFFVVSVPLYTPIPPNGTVSIEIGYRPSSVGTCTDTLRIYNGNPFPSNMTVSGTGVMPEQEEPDTVDVTSQLLAQIAEIKTFMEESLDKGSLEVAGKGREESQGRLKAFNKMLVVTAHMIENGRLQAAQNKLRAIYKKTDGKPSPQDFFKGGATVELAARIEALIDSLNYV